MVRFVVLLLFLLPHGSARTLAPNQAAYAQRVARQAAVSAERAAVSAERLARSAATSAKDALDTDNDGMVSTEELEGSIERLWSRCAGITRRAGRFYAKYRDACLATGGMLGLLHGGKVAYTILCARAFAATGWPMVRQSVAKMGDAYTAAKREMVGTVPVSPEEYAAMQAQLQEMAAEMEELVGDGASERRKEVLLCQMRALRAELDATAVHRALPVLLAAFEPTLVRDVVLGLWSGLTLSVAAASSAAARSLGIGVSIGEVQHAAAPRPVRPLPPSRTSGPSANSHAASPPISGRPHSHLAPPLPPSHPPLTPCRLDRHRLSVRASPRPHAASRWLRAAGCVASLPRPPHSRPSGRAGCSEAPSACSAARSAAGWRSGCRGSLRSSPSVCSRRRHPLGAIRPTCPPPAPHLPAPDMPPF